MNLKERIERPVAGIVEKEGFELVELAVYDRGPKTMVRVFAERPAGGISVDDCALLSRKLSDFFALENVFERAYVLEVSSPGVSRILTSRRDFERKLGRLVRVWFSKDGATLETAGRLLAVSDAGLLLQTDRGGEETFSFGDLIKGKEILREGRSSGRNVKPREDQWSSG